MHVFDLEGYPSCCLRLAKSRTVLTTPWNAVALRKNYARTLSAALFQQAQLCRQLDLLAVQ